MRRLIPSLALLALPLLGPAPASACAPPEEPGGPTTCCQGTLYSATVGDTTVHVPDPRIRLYCS